MNRRATDPTALDAAVGQWIRPPQGLRAMLERAAKAELHDVQLEELLTDTATVRVEVTVQNLGQKPDGGRDLSP